MKRIAIACQGGGSHTAFTAGALSVLCERWNEQHELVCISGTSGGAICASLFWSAFVQGKPELASERLENFWRDNMARTPFELALNNMMVAGASLKGWLPTLEISPYQMPVMAEEMFAQLLRRHLDFEEWNRLLGEGSPVLQIGAVDVLDGCFTIFDSAQQPISVDMVRASAAIPNLFRAVEIDGHHYWDGLFSHNPPLVSMLNYDPDELWVIQINPRRSERLPKTVEEIEDRRNELAGNLSLEQEIASIQMINGLLARKELTGSRCCPVKIRRIQMDCDLNYASKLERSPEFIESLMAKGVEQALEFLAS